LLLPVPELLDPVPELELPMPLLLGEVELLPDELGDELGDELLGDGLLLGELLLVPPLEELLLPDLLKCASHSAREIEPSLFLSTAENDGVELLELLAPPEALGEDDEEDELGEDELGEAALGEDEELLGEDELLEAPPEALPEDLLLSVALGVEELLLGEDELLDAPPEALPEDLLLSVALGLEELLLSLLPVLCADATPASAKSAAAVAVTTTFNFIWIPPRRVGERRPAAGLMQSPCPQDGWAREFLHTRVMESRALTLGAAAALASAAFVQQRAWSAERDSPPLGRIVEVDGVRMHYLDRGQGPPLVMLHGNGSMLQELRLSGLYPLAAARYRVVVPDRPGYGHSSRPRRRRWGPRAQAALLRALLARIGVERPIVFGHSFGALVALAYALDYPAETRGVVLASGYYFPTARLDVPFMASPAFPLFGDLMRHTVSPLIARALWPRMLMRLFSPAPVPRYFQLLPTWMALRPSQLRAAAEDAALFVPAALRMQRRYRTLEVPAVIVAGAQDRHVDPARHSIALARRIAGAELVVSPRAGHMVHHVDPRRVLHAIDVVAR
jgi:pimeloyl-ACP methyl ester carboxylesterase